MNPNKGCEKLIPQIDDEEGIQVRCFAKVAEAIEALKPDFHVDLHTFSTLSLPFVFLDRILYHHNSEEDLEAAKKLFDKTQVSTEKKKNLKSLSPFLPAFSRLTKNRQW
jgi:hypothetical protein